MKTTVKTVIIFASCKKEAKQIALENYGSECLYVRPYRYASKGNNFYEFRHIEPSGTSV